MVVADPNDASPLQKASCPKTKMKCWRLTQPVLPSVPHNMHERNRSHLEEAIFVRKSIASTQVCTPGTQIVMSANKEAMTRRDHFCYIAGT